MANSSLYLISGDNPTEITKKTNEVVQDLTAGNIDPFGCDIYAMQEGGDPTELLQQFIRSAKTPGFMGDKIVCLQDFDFFDQEPSKSEDKPSSLGKLLNELISFIETSSLMGISLIISGMGIDSRKTLYKLCRKKGNAFIFKKLQLTDRNWNREMASYISEQAQQKGLKLSYDVVDYLVSCIGTDAGLVDGELEKIWCYNLGQRVSLEDVKSICHGEGESATWSFTNALCERNTESAYQTLNILLKNSKNAKQAVIGIILNAASSFVLLLKITILMKQKQLSTNGLKSFLESISSEEKGKYGEKGFADVVKLHPFRAMKLAEQASRYTEKELVQAILYLRDCNLSSIHEDIDHRTMLEEIILRISMKRYK